jgi:hypothetical protein
VNQLSAWQPLPAPRRGVGADSAMGFSTGTASLGYGRRASSNIGCNSGLARLRHRGEFSYVVSRSEDIDLK